MKDFVDNSIGFKEEGYCRVSCSLRALPNIYICIRDRGGWDIKYLGLFQIHGEPRLLYTFTCEEFERLLSKGEIT